MDILKQKKIMNINIFKQKFYKYGYFSTKESQEYKYLIIKKFNKNI